MAGFVDPFICLVCQAGIGTVPHRTWHCQAIHWDRVQGISDDLVQEARVALEAEPNHPFWCRGFDCAEWFPFWRRGFSCSQRAAMGDMASSSYSRIIYKCVCDTIDIELR